MEPEGRRHPVRESPHPRAKTLTERSPVANVLFKIFSTSPPRGERSTVPSESIRELDNNANPRQKKRYRWKNEEYCRILSRHGITDFRSSSLLFLLKLCAVFELFLSGQTLRRRNPEFRTGFSVRDTTSPR